MNIQTARADEKIQSRTRKYKMLFYGHRWLVTKTDVMAGSEHTLARLAVKSTHSNSSPIFCRNSSTWGRFNTYTCKIEQRVLKIHSVTRVPNKCMTQCVKCEKSGIYYNVHSFIYHNMMLCTRTHVILTHGLDALLSSPSSCHPVQVIMNRPTRIHTAYPGLLELDHSHSLQVLP